MKEEEGCQSPEMIFFPIRFSNILLLKILNVQNISVNSHVSTI